MKNIKTKMNYCNFLCFSFIKKQTKFWPAGNIDLPGSPYSLHGYSGQLGARLTSVEKAIWTCSHHSMLFLMSAGKRVKWQWALKSINLLTQLPMKKKCHALERTKNHLKITLLVENWPVSQFFPIAVGLRVGQREGACNAEKNLDLYFLVLKFNKKFELWELWFKKFRKQGFTRY